LIGLLISAAGIKVQLDDIGRLSVSRSDARALIAERRESEQKAREAAEAADRWHEDQRRASLRPGVPWYEVPEGMTAATFMGLGDRPGSRRQTLTADVLFSNPDDLEFHPFPSAEDE
jgi:hypothetical protein